MRRPGGRSGTTVGSRAGMGLGALTVRRHEQLLLLLCSGQQLPAPRGGPGAQGSGQARLHALRREHLLEAAPGRAVIQRRGQPVGALRRSPHLFAQPEQGAPCGRGRGSETAAAGGTPGGVTL